MGEIEDELFGPTSTVEGDVQVRGKTGVSIDDDGNTWLFPRPNRAWLRLIVGREGEGLQITVLNASSEPDDPQLYDMVIPAELAGALLRGLMFAFGSGLLNVKPDSGISVEPR